MAILAGQFAGIVHVSVPSNKADALRAELLALEKSSLHIAIAEGTTTVNQPNRRQVQLELTGLDHAGIVRDITQALVNVGISVAEFESQQYDGSMSGEKNVPRQSQPYCTGRSGSCLLYTSPSPRDRQKSRMPSSA